MNPKPVDARTRVGPPVDPRVGPRSGRRGDPPVDPQVGPRGGRPGGRRGGPLGDRRGDRRGGPLGGPGDDSADGSPFGPRFDSVFGAVYEPLQRYVRRRIDPSLGADVDDVLAETLTVLWRRIADIPEGDEVPWSFGVARRVLANHRRGDRRRVRLGERLRHEWQRHDPRDNEQPQAAVLHPDADAALHAALLELSTDDRELIRLWAWEQLQPREIAIVLDISANAVSIRLHRAKQQLAIRLGDFDRTRKIDGAPGHAEGGHPERNSA